MNQKRVWRLCTLLPDLPGESEVASLRVPGPSGNSCDDQSEILDQGCTAHKAAVRS